MVDHLIAFVPAEVFPSVLDGSDPQDDTDWYQVHLGLKSIDHGDKIQNRDAHKIEIGKAVELLEGVFGYEGQHCVLAGLNVVPAVMPVGVLLEGPAFKGQVGDHHSFLVILPFPPPLPLLSHLCWVPAL